MFLIYPFIGFASLLFAALTMALAPVLVLFADASGNLPGWLALFQTFDATLDAGWRDGYFGTWKADGTTPAGWRRWWLRTRWLWRNPGYTFDSVVLGCAFDPSGWRVLAYSEVPGRVTFIAWGPAARFNVYLQRGNFYLKLGWKAWNNWNATTWNARPPNGWDRLPICCSVTRRQ